MRSVFQLFTTNGDVMAVALGGTLIISGKPAKWANQAGIQSL